MTNWKIALTTVLLFTFVALPAVGQEMNIPSLKKLDVLAWSSHVMMSKENTPHLDNPEVKIAEEAGEFSKLAEGVHKTQQLSLAAEHEEPAPHSIAGEPEHGEKETGLLPFLRNVFRSAMDF